MTEDIGRFTSIDPLFEKFPGWTPYQYCANNPIISLDPSGLKLTLSGGETYVNESIDVINKGLGGYYTAFKGKDGRIQLRKEQKEGNMTSSQANFYRIMNTIIGDPKDLKIGIVKDSKEIFIGSAAGHKIDIGDINKIGDGPLTNSVAAFTHEIVEQFRIQIYNESEGAAHDKGILKENAITGTTKINNDPIWEGTRDMVNGSSVYSGKFTFPYKEGRVIMEINQNNIIKVNQILNK